MKACRYGVHGRGGLGGGVATGQRSDENLERLSATMMVIGDTTAMGMLRSVGTNALPLAGTFVSVTLHTLKIVSTTPSNSMASKTAKNTDLERS